MKTRYLILAMLCSFIAGACLTWTLLGNYSTMEMSGSLYRIDKRTGAVWLWQREGWAKIPEKP